MEYKKGLIGKASQWTCFAKDTDTQCLSIASRDGSMSIYSPDDILIYEWKTDNFHLTHLLLAKDYVAGLADFGGLHIWQKYEKCESLDYQYKKLDLNDGISISCIHHCQHLGKVAQLKNMFPLSIGDDHGNFQIWLISGNSIVRSNRISLASNIPSSFKKIDQILEIFYEDNISIAFVLINKTLCKIRYRVVWQMNENLEIVEMHLHLVQKLSINCTETDVIWMESFGDCRIVVATNSGKYVVLQSGQSENGKIVENDVVFPYGPFPCNEITKCLVTHLLGIKGECFIFSGGMPATTYKHLNTVSVSVDNEPEICFTFDDAVVDFTVTTSSSSWEFDEILVLTSSELISISYQNGTWISDIHNHLSPFSKNEVTGISNIVEIVNEEKCSFLNGYTDYIDDEDALVQVFAVSLNDFTISIWCLSENRYSLLGRIDLNRLDQSFPIQENGKKILWPRFQKCGSWKNPVKEKSIIEMIKFIKDSDGWIYLLISTNKTSIFLFRILFRFEEESQENCGDTKWVHHHLSINNKTGSINNDQVNNREDNYSDCAYLVAWITLDDTLETFAMDFNVKSHIINFGGSAGVGCIDIDSGKHIFLEATVLEKIEKMKSGSQLMKLIHKTFHKRISIEPPLTKNETGTKIKTKSMFLWQSNQDKLNLILGFNNGSVLILELLLDENGNFIVDNKFKTCQPTKDLDVIDVRIIEMTSDAIACDNYATSLYPDMSMGDSNSLEKKPNPSLTSSTNMEIKLRGTPTASSNSNDGTSLKSGRPASSTLQWFTNRPKKSKMKTFLLKCNACSVKIIDYSKMKTKYKLKISEYYGKEIEPTGFKKKVSPDVSIPKIVNSWIMRSNHVVNEWQYWLLLINNDIIQLHLPTLSVLKTINLNVQIPHHKLLSIHLSLIVLAENKYTRSQLMVLSEHHYHTYNLLRRDKRISTEIPGDIINDETNQIDFMKEAKISLSSLLC